MAVRATVDKPFLFSIIALVVFGFLIFSSASLGLLAREGASFSSVAFNQLFFGIFGGLVLLLVTSNIHYRFWRKYALWIFIGSLLFTFLVFIPGIGFEYNGARRWIHIGALPSFQPAELLKIGYVIYLATWLSGVKAKVATLEWGTLPFLAITGIMAIAMILQPDTGTFLVMFSAGVAMYLAAGARPRDLIILAVGAILCVALLALFRPYVRDRIETFLNPADDPHGSSYQIQQSLIAIGSGKIAGRGFGQSVQKFDFLPEPIGDSIFAVAAEEFGFVGALLLILIFVFITIRGLRIASRAPDVFGGLLAVGIVILIIAQAFINIGAMLGVLPLTGIPLIFVSHGGSALAVGLGMIGILLNISKHQRN